MRKGYIFLFIMTVVCLISMTFIVLELHDNPENQKENGYFHIFYTPAEPVEFEDVLIYAYITFPKHFLPYLISYDGKGTSKVLMLKVNDTCYIGQLNAEERGREYEFWVALIDDNSSLDSPFLCSKHFSFTVYENIYPPILSNVYHYPSQPTINDTVTFRATMRNARNIRYDVILDYNVMYSNGMTKNLSIDMVRIQEGIVFSYTSDPEPENTTISYRVSIWYSFKSMEIVRSQEYSFIVV